MPARFTIPAAILLACTASLHGQVVRAAAGPQLTGQTIEWTSRKRWLHGRQRPEFTPFETDEETGAIDTVVDGPPRLIHVGFNMVVAADLTVDEGGRIVLAQARIGRPRSSGLTFPGLDPWSSRRYAESDSLNAETRMWEDSAAVRYTERMTNYERSLGADAVTERRTTGTIRGTTLYDPARRFFYARADTTELTGIATLLYPDRRRFETTARFEQTRRIQLYDSAAYEAHEAEQRAANRFSILIEPRTPIEKRLRAGDTALCDSLLGVWDRSHDPDERERLGRVISSWARQGSAVEARMKQLALHRGDTLYLHTRARTASTSDGDTSPRQQRTAQDTYTAACSSHEETVEIPGEPPRAAVRVLMSEIRGHTSRMSEGLPVCI